MAVPNGLNPTFYSVNTLNGYYVNDVCIIDSTGAIIAPISLSLGDDDILTAGTTTTTAATKVTMEFDKATTGIGQFKMGDTSNPQVLNTNPGAAVIGSTINILHSAGAGDCDDLIGSYSKVAISGSGDSGLTAVGGATRAYVLAGVASQVYGFQPWASHDGTGAVTAMSGLSAKVDVNTGAFTATTVNAGHFHIEGAATVTSSMFDGVMIEVYPDVTCLDAGLRIVADTGAVMATGIDIQGVMTNAILAPNDANVRIGTTRTTAETYIGMEFDETTTGVGIMTMGSISAPMVLNTNPGATVAVDTVNVLHSAGAGDCDDLLGRYTKVAISGAGDSGLTAVADAPRAYVLAGAASQVYASQPWAKHVGTGAVTAMSALSAKLQLNDGDAFTSTNSLNAGHFHIETVSGAANGTVTSNNFDGVMIEAYPNVTGMKSMLSLALDGGTTVTSAIRVAGSAGLTNLVLLDGASGCVTTELTGGTPVYIRVSINGKAYTIKADTSA